MSGDKIWNERHSNNRLNEEFWVNVYTDYKHADGTFYNRWYGAPRSTRKDADDPLLWGRDMRGPAYRIHVKPHEPPYRKTTEEIWA